MKIIDMLRQDRPTLSFEVFPPKTSDTYDSVAKATQEIAALRPDFMSVTYGAGGGTSDYTVGIASGIRERYGVEVLAHLTCLSSTRDHVARVLEQLREKGIQNVLALRGDVPEGGAPAHDYQYAAQLVRGKVFDVAAAEFAAAAKFSPPPDAASARPQGPHAAPSFA